MDKTQFWQIIDTARETAGGWQGMDEPLAAALSKLDAPDIIRWDQIFDEYRNLAYKDKIWAAAAVMHEGCSKDGFEAFIGWLIAQGKDVYLATLEDPDSLADVESVRAFGREVRGFKTAPADGFAEAAYFEAVLYAAYNAYGGKTGRGDFYNEISANPLSEEEKSEIAADVRYADDIDDNWWSAGDSWNDVSKKLSAMLPDLYKEFNKTEKSRNKKHKHKRA